MIFRLRLLGQTKSIQKLRKFFLLFFLTFYALSVKLFNHLLSTLSVHLIDELERLEHWNQIRKIQDSLINLLPILLFLLFHTNICSFALLPNVTNSQSRQ